MSVQNSLVHSVVADPQFESQGSCEDRSSPVPRPIARSYTPSPDWAYQRVWKWYTDATLAATKTPGGAVAVAFGAMAIAFVCLLLLIGGKISEACSDNEPPTEVIDYQQTADDQGPCSLDESYAAQAEVSGNS